MDTSQEDLACSKCTPHWVDWQLTWECKTKAQCTSHLIWFWQNWIEDWQWRHFQGQITLKLYFTYKSSPAAYWLYCPYFDPPLWPLIYISSKVCLWHISISGVYGLKLTSVTVLQTHWPEPLERGKALVVYIVASQRGGVSNKQHMEVSDHWHVGCCVHVQ